MLTKVVEMIRMERRIGNGTEEYPFRVVVGYWMKNGKLIAEYDINDDPYFEPEKPLYRNKVSELVNETQNP